LIGDQRPRFSTTLLGECDPLRRLPRVASRFLHEPRYDFRRRSVRHLADQGVSRPGRSRSRWLAQCHQCQACAREFCVSVWPDRRTLKTEVRHVRSPRSLGSICGNKHLGPFPSSFFDLLRGSQRFRGVVFSGDGRQLRVHWSSSLNLQKSESRKPPVLAG